MRVLFILVVSVLVVMLRMLVGLLVLEFWVFCIVGMLNSIMLLMFCFVVLVVVFCSELIECCVMLGIDLMVMGFDSFLWMNRGSMSCCGLSDVLWMRF